MDYIQELDNIKSWIKNLLIIQYRQSQKNRALIDMLVELTFAKCLPQQIRDLCLNVDESYGEQLDIIGKWVGIDRVYNAADIWNHPYLSFLFYSQIKNPSSINNLQGGFSLYSNFADNDGGFLTYKQWQQVRTAVNKFGDEFFKPLIKLKIIKNSINHTMRNIDEAIFGWGNGKICYSGSIVQVGSSLYSDKILNKKYGTVSAITTNSITVIDNNNETLYKGYFNYTSITENGTTYYEYSLVPIYTTWQPMELTYHYDSTAKTDQEASYDTIMMLAQYKNALPCPTGCKLIVTPISST